MNAKKGCDHSQWWGGNFTGWSQAWNYRVYLCLLDFFFWGGRGVGYRNISLLENLYLSFIRVIFFKSTSLPPKRTEIDCVSQMSGLCHSQNQMDHRGFKQPKVFTSLVICSRLEIIYKECHGNMSLKSKVNKVFMLLQARHEYEPKRSETCCVWLSTYGWWSSAKLSSNLNGPIAYNRFHHAAATASCCLGSLNQGTVQRCNKWRKKGWLENSESKMDLRTSISAPAGHVKRCQTDPTLQWSADCSTNKIKWQCSASDYINNKIYLSIRRNPLSYHQCN